MCDSWYQVTYVLISITCGTEHLHSVAVMYVTRWIQGSYNRVEHVVAMLLVRTRQLTFRRLRATKVAVEKQ